MDITIELTENVVAASDITCHWKAADVLKEANHQLRELYNKLASDNSSKGEDISCNVVVMIRGVRKPLNARGFVCLCGAGQYISGTFRLTLDQGERPDLNMPTTEALTKIADSADKALFQPQVVSEHLIDKLLPPPYPAQGLLVVSGSTKSGKTQQSKSLVLMYLKKLIEDEKQNKWHHLVTFEDPIETWPFAAREDAVEAALKHNLWFTPRELGKDVRSLQDGVHHALRQTPACYYIGEVRKDDDWKSALGLAGKGHLVVATAHAGSVSETLSAIFQAMKADTPQQRAFVAHRIKGVVHLQILPLGWGDTPNVMMPSYWKQTARSLDCLISDGLSSAIPNRDFAYGRQHVVEDLLALRKPEPNTAEQRELLEKCAVMDILEP